MINVPLKLLIGSGAACILMSCNSANDLNSPNKSDKVEMAALNNQVDKTVNPRQWHWLDILTQTKPPYFATTTNSQAIDVYEGFGTDVTVEIKDDNCVYYRYPDGKLILPILTNGFATPDQISRYFQAKDGQTLKEIVDFDVDLNNADFHPDSSKWLSLSPQSHCQYHDKAVIDYFTIIDVIRDNLYSNLSADELNKVDSDDIDSEFTRLPKSDSKTRFISIYNQSPVPLSELSPNLLTTVRGKLQTDDKQCLYLFSEDDQRYTLRFQGDRVYWQDDINALNIDGKIYQLDKPYTFTMSTKFDATKLFPYPTFNFEKFIRQPNSICDNTAMRYVEKIE